MEQHATPTIRVLLVDDQELVLAAFAALLGSADGIEIVAAAGSVEEAVRYSLELQPDIVVMDVLSETGVFEGVREILARCPRTRLVLLDDAPQDCHVREALRLGLAGYLTKQQSFAQFEAAVRLAMRGERVYAPSVARRLVLSPEGVRLAVENKHHVFARLTPREMDVLVHLSQGYSVRQCAEVLGIGESTVGNHKSRLMKKLGIHKTVELTRLAIREGLIPGGQPNHQPNSS